MSAPPATLTRRTALIGGMFAATGVSLRPAPAAATVQPQPGGNAVSMAMHVHGSCSEGLGSMEAQLWQAAAAQVDVLWWTDHAHRMNAYGYITALHCDALAEKMGGGAAWTWQITAKGGATARVATPGAPGDGGGGCFALTAPAGGTVQIAGSDADGRTRTSLVGTTFTFDVNADQTSATSWAELTVTTSHRPAATLTTAASPVLHYRFGGPDQQPRLLDQLNAVVPLTAGPGWQTVTVNPSADLTHLFGFDGRDASPLGIAFTAASTTGTAACQFDYLRINRPAAFGTLNAQTQQQLAAGYTARYPVTQQFGREIDCRDRHVLGYTAGIPTNLPPTTTAADAATQIRQAGGLVSYAHPFGTTWTAARDDPRIIQARIAAMLADPVMFDIVEVGFTRRGGVSTDGHLTLLDTLARNQTWITGVGVSDDHNGVGWQAGDKNWTTTVQPRSLSERDLCVELSAGRASFAQHNQVGGYLDLTVNGCPAGSVSASGLRTRQAHVSVPDVPAGTQLRIRQGPVDQAGAVAASTPTVSTGPASTVTVTVDTSRPTFIRAELVKAGQIIGSTNPVWLLATMPSGVPANRRA